MVPPMVPAILHEYGLAREENPLDEPVGASSRHEQRPDPEKLVCVPRVLAAEAQYPGCDREHDRRLARLDPDVERRERPAEMAARQPQLAQHVREAEAVDEPERE